MEGIVRMLLENVPALLCAVIVVTFVSPTTKSGALILGLVTFAAVVLITQIVRFIRKTALRKDLPPSKPTP